MRQGISARRGTAIPFARLAILYPRHKLPLNYKEISDIFRYIANNLLCARSGADSRAVIRTGKHMEKVFDALASGVRRKILAYLSATSLTAGEIAARFDITKPSLSKHLSILENAGLVKGEKKGQFIHYSLVRENLVNTLNGYVQEVCPVARP